MNNNPPTQHSSAATNKRPADEEHEQALGRDSDEAYAEEWQANRNQMFLDELIKKKKETKPTEICLSTTKSIVETPTLTAAETNAKNLREELEYMRKMYNEKKELERQNHYYRMELIYEASKQPLATGRTAAIVKFATTLTEEHSYVDELYTIGPRTKDGDELYATKTVTPSNTGVKILASPTMPEPVQVEHAVPRVEKTPAVDPQVTVPAQVKQAGPRVEQNSVLKVQRAGRCENNRQAYSTQDTPEPTSSLRATRTEQDYKN